MFLYVGILLFSVIISSFSQVLLKKSALRNYDSFIKQYLNLYVIIAYSIYFIAILLDLFALKKLPVSYIPVIESSSYVFILFFDKIFFDEKISIKKLVSIGIIIAGIFVYIIN